MMNSQFAIDRADHLAGLVIGAQSELADQLSLAWVRCYGRPIDTAMLVELQEFVRQQTSMLQSRDEELTPEAVASVGHGERLSGDAEFQ